MAKKKVFEEIEVWQGQADSPGEEGQHESHREEKPAVKSCKNAGGPGFVGKKC